MLSMVQAPRPFPGSERDKTRLLSVLNHNCDCDPEHNIVCAPHKMLVDDPRAVNGLLFERRIADQLVTEEWHV
jgi:hypothetical protein